MGMVFTLFCDQVFMVDRLSGVEGLDVTIGVGAVLMIFSIPSDDDKDTR